MAEAKIALFIDMDNIVYASENFGLGRMQINPIIEVLKEKGRLIIKRAYADWRHHSQYRFEMQQHAIELFELPQRGPTNKNSTDIKMVVDAMEIAYTKDHIDTFAIVTGDKDFSPLVTKLREHNLQVMGFGVRESTSDLLVQNCDEFIYYNNIIQSNRLTSEMDRENIYQLLVDSVQALMSSDQLYAPAHQIKKTLLRKNPAFHEGNYGFKSFAAFLRNAASKNLIQLRSSSRYGSLEVDLGKARETETAIEIADEKSETKSLDYSAVLSSVGLRPGSPEMRRRVLKDISGLLRKLDASSDRMLNSVIDELADHYETEKIKIYKSSIRDIVRMMMYIGCFKDPRDKFISSYSVPVAKFSDERIEFWLNCLSLIHILKSDPELKDTAQACKLLFGAPRRKSELTKLLRSMHTRKLIKESRKGSIIKYTTLTDRHFIPWK